MKTDYVSPQIEVLDFYPEGVLCQSNESLDEYPGYWDYNIY